MYPEIVLQQERLNRLFKHANDLQKKDDIDEEVKAQFVWYLCVRTSGYVEFSIKTILREYVSLEANSSPRIADYIHNQINKRTLNPKREKVLDLLAEFNPKWKEHLKKPSLGELKDSLESIVNNRNHIAHGSDVSISLKDLEKYFSDAQKIVKLVYDECNKKTP